MYLYFFFCIQLSGVPMINNSCCFILSASSPGILCISLVTIFPIYKKKKTQTHSCFVETPNKHPLIKYLPGVVYKKKKNRRKQAKQKCREIINLAKLRQMGAGPGRRSGGDVDDDDLAGHPPVDET